MSESETSFWHPFADMHAVRGAELVIDRAEDVWVWDDAGNRYLDATASLWYANVGHGRKEIAEAAYEQMLRLEAYSTFGDFTNRPAGELAAMLAERAPMAGAKVFLVSGGGDGIDTAAKLARRYWEAVGKPEKDHLVSRRHAYHGTHGFGTSLAGIPPNRAGFGSLIAASSQVAHDDAGALAAEIERVGADRVAAFFCEPVIGAGGVHQPPPGYIEEVARICRENDVLFVVDAVICGFGRLGTWFGIERWPGIEPDLIVFAKGVTSGYLPLGGVVASARVAEPFWERGGNMFRHGATYSGHPACCAAAIANVRLLEDGLLERGRELEGALAERLRSLADHDAVGEVRCGIGLLGAVALAPEVLERDPAAPVKLGMRVRERGVLVRPLGDSVACSPPLTIQEPELDLIQEALASALEGFPAG